MNRRSGPSYGPELTAKQFASPRRHALRDPCTGNLRSLPYVVGMLTIILIILLLFALGGGGWGYSRYGALGLGPAGLILLVLVILMLTGNLHGPW